jgi:hypothetical protein
MKNIIVSIFALLLISLTANAQTEFGVKGGLNFTFFKVTEGDFGTNPNTEVGYYGGVFVDFKIDNGFHFQPELLYKGVGEFEFLNAPMYLKYDINNDFHVLIGPSLNYFFDVVNANFKVRADLSLDYNLSYELSLHMKYTIGFEELSPNIIFLGLGYKL